jgi:acyl carrier protein
MADNSNKVKDIIEKELGVEREKLTNEASFIEDLGADSLDIVELVMEFEKEFNIDIPDEDAEKLRTVGDALGYLNQKVGAGADLREVGDGADHQVRRFELSGEVCRRAEGVQSARLHGSERGQEGGSLHSVRSRGRSPGNDRRRARGWAERHGPGPYRCHHR